VYRPSAGCLLRCGTHGAVWRSLVLTGADLLPPCHLPPCSQDQPHGWRQEDHQQVRAALPRSQQAALLTRPPPLPIGSACLSPALRPLQASPAGVPATLLAVTALRTLLATARHRDFRIKLDGAEGGGGGGGGGGGSAKPRKRAKKEEPAQEQQQQEEEEEGGGPPLPCLAWGWTALRAGQLRWRAWAGCCALHCWSAPVRPAAWHGG
jgi:hypothetical protein